MPELPEMEAWRRALDGPVSAAPIEKAGPAHVATLKTVVPPLTALEGAASRARGGAASASCFRPTTASSCSSST